MNFAIRKLSQNYKQLIYKRKKSSDSPVIAILWTTPMFPSLSEKGHFGISVSFTRGTSISSHHPSLYISFMVLVQTVFKSSLELLHFVGSGTFGADCCIYFQQIGTSFFLVYFVRYSVLSVGFGINKCSVERAVFYQFGGCFLFSTGFEFLCEAYRGFDLLLLVTQYSRRKLRLPKQEWRDEKWTMIDRFYV